jgi:uncharacterized protein (DUF362 family)/Pyruvate/2-oxoacid:ferredoxin oxidoreductase delta subunit
MSRVEILKCPDYESSEEELRKILPSFEIFNKLSGKKILIKINLLSDAIPDEAVTTNPKFVDAVIKVFKSIGCQVLVGDSPYESAKTFLSKVYKKTGIEEVCERNNVTLIDFIDYKEVTNENNTIAKVIPVSNAVLDVDYIINVPKLKTHGLTYMTCGVKNMFGVIPGVKKAEYHLRLKSTENFCNFLVDLASTIKPVLTIVDGIISMEGAGPRNGNPRKTDLILISEDVFAIDWIAAQIIGIKPDLIPTNKVSLVRNFINPNEIQITGMKLEDAEIKDFVKIDKPITPIPYSKYLLNFLDKYITGKPYIDDKKCTRCQICLKRCPAKAISIDNGIMSIDLSKCIKCYCCAEFCPNGAATIKYTWISKWLRSRLK